MLNDFNSFFEIFAALNLAYAGSDNFRSSLDNIVVKFIDEGILPNLKKRIELLHSKMIVLIAEPNATTPQIAQNIANLESEVQKACESPNDPEVYTNGFKSMFLITFFYCIAMVVLAGYEAIWAKTNLNSENDNTVNLFLIFSWPIIVFNLVVFIRSFTKNHFKNIPPIYTLGIIGSLFGLAIWALEVCPYVIQIENYFAKQTCITSTLFVAISPYILHVIRALLGNIIKRVHILYVSFKLTRYLNKVEKALDLIFKQSK